MGVDNLQVHLVTTPRTISWKRSGRHRHSFHELGIVAEGEMEWHFDEDRPLRVKEGQAILIPAGLCHYETLTRPARVAWVGYEGMLHALPLKKPVPLLGWERVILSRIEEMGLEFACYPNDAGKRIVFLLADLLTLLRRAAEKIAPMPVSDRLESARLLLEKKSELSVTQVARYHGLSLAHFEVLFAQRFHVSPKEYQQRCRLNRVKESIALGERSPKRLAAMHGFGDPAYFCRWFRKLTGETVTSYGAARAQPPSRPGRSSKA